MLKFPEQLTPKAARKIDAALRSALSALQQPAPASPDPDRLLADKFPNASIIYSAETATKTITGLIECLQAKETYHITDYHYILIYDALIAAGTGRHRQSTIRFIDQTFYDTDFLMAPRNVITMGIQGRAFLDLTEENIGIALGARPTADELNPLKLPSTDRNAVNGVTRVFCFADHHTLEPKFTQFLDMLYHAGDSPTYPELAGKHVKIAIAYVFHQHGKPSGTAMVEQLTIRFDQHGSIPEGTYQGFMDDAAMSRWTEPELMRFRMGPEEIERSKTATRSLTETAWTPTESQADTINKALVSSFGPLHVEWHWKRDIDISQRTAWMFR